MEKETIKNIAVDLDELYMLAKWAYLDDYDNNGVLARLYRRHQLIPSKLREPEVRNAPLMQDSWVHAIRRDKFGDKYFDNLNSLTDLYEACMDNNINLFIVPTVFNGVLRDMGADDEKTRLTATHAFDFVRDCATVLHVNEQDYPEFYGIRRKLAQEYIKAGIFRKDQQVRANALAESALFGLHYVVKKDAVYVHYDYIKGDCGKLKKIAQIHRENGIIAYDKNNGMGVYPGVWTARFLMMKDRKKSMGEIYYPMWADSDAMCDGVYVPKVER